VPRDLPLVTLGTNKPYLFFSFSISMLSKAAVIIITACSSITLLFIVLIINRRYSRQSTPLPSIQPLAHHRVQLVDQLQNSSTLTLLQQPIHVVTGTTSKPLPPMPPDLPSKRTLLSNIESQSAASCSTKNSYVRPGLPHGPLSQIEIILPVPLALNARQGVGTKSAIADRWASVGTGKKISLCRGGSS
jgi:hypothetical protein